jgi:hypothetical protein
MQDHVGYVTTYPLKGWLRCHLQDCLEKGYFDDLFDASGSACLFIPRQAHKVTHWSTVLFAENPRSVVLDIQRIESSSKCKPIGWSAAWSTAQESESGGNPDESTPELSTQTVFLRGFYIFKRPSRPSAHHSSMGEHTGAPYDIAESQPSLPNQSFALSSTSAYASAADAPEEFPERDDASTHVIQTDVEEVSIHAHAKILTLMSFANERHIVLYQKSQTISSLYVYFSISQSAD